MKNIGADSFVTDAIDKNTRKRSEMRVKQENQSESEKNSVVSQEKTVLNNKIDKIQEAYLQYLQSGEEKFFHTVIQVLDSMCIVWIRNYLQGNRRYVTGDLLEEILQEARLNVWRDMNTTRKEQKEPRSTYGWYARGIYLNCARKEQEYYLSNKNYANVNANSVELMNETGSTISVGSAENSIVVQQGNRTIVNNVDIQKPDYVLQKERSNFYVNFLEAYIRTLMETKESPENCLAVMYTRLLPHAMDEIRDSLMSSVKWAKNQMGDYDIGYLSVDSENKMIENGFSYYRWGKNYIEQLDKEVVIQGNQLLLRQVKYLETYDKGRNLEHMDRNTHKVLQKETFKKIVRDPKLRALALEYVEKEDRMYKLIGGDRL